jgi:hypothetical protein
MVRYTGLQVVLEAMKSGRILRRDSGRRDEMKSSARSNVTVIIDASFSIISGISTTSAPSHELPALHKQSISATKPLRTRFPLFLPTFFPFYQPN